ncbi:ABC transporter ATP-binding protein [Agrobacterium rubi]|uniref:ABC transporter ATP-binding protein n=1 Tax=Agrobacterium rubi TaxID=28099 RepID=UPI0015716CFC|nr:ABC transporter ATP-binding protein [Agrobacterium rubi]NTF10586.1 ABC transporter ATP-binding protein [Agrobacterium rubi]NTF22980.1 ABC transporter ATP-binding protein [Agrobacterium rubi]NTF29911.1 ABC transporter ATP-binding protein [Agrobacterium rubi]
MSRPLLKLDGVGKDYSGKSALAHITASIPDNTYISLLGPSGSGKTTLLRLIAGFESPDRGTIAFKGKDLLPIPSHERGIGFVFQNFALFPHLNVAENVAFGLKYRRNSPLSNSESLRRTVRGMLELVGLAGLAERAVQQLSGGQRQRVALARTLITEPQVVLLDEPLGALDANLRMRMRHELRTIRERIGVTFLHVTGSESEALAMGDTVLILHKGSIEQSGRPQEVFARPATAAAAAFLNSYNIFKGERRTNMFECQGGVSFDVNSAVSVDATEASYAVRHDRIRVREANAPALDDEEAICARFVTSEYLGSAVHAFFTPEQGGIVEVEAHLSHGRPPEYEPDKLYKLVWKRNSAIVYARPDSSLAEAHS